jgi:putative FmdB family regulatory protein
MPTYVFECPECDHLVEHTLRVSNRNEAISCERCDHSKMKRIIARPHIAPIGGIPNCLNQHWNEGGKILYGDNEHVPEV